MAAGLGFKTFTTGEVLSAADVNGYLMQGVLVFATEAARNSAITSPQEGQFAYTKDNNSLWYYTGSAWAASGGGSTAVGVTAFTSSAQNTTSGTATVINLNSEAFDTDSMHSTATNTSRLTIPTGKGGYYLVNVMTVIDAGGNDVFITILKNGTTITGYGQWNNNRMAASNYGGAGYVIAWGSQSYPLAAGDYIEVAVTCAKATGANCLNMTFSAMYLGA
jgi:hypothetical protein